MATGRTRLGFDTLMGFMMPKAPTPQIPPPPPTAPTFNPNKGSAFDPRGVLGGTFLTQGQKLGTTGSGKSLLGA